MSLDEVLTALRHSHELLVGALSDRGEAELRGPSYDDDWNIGQVASHLGSGAVIFSLYLEAGRTGSPAPEIEQIQPIWDEWNAKSPVAQSESAIRADAELLAQIDTLDAAQREAWSLDLFGERRTLEGVLRMRLAEHALHTWDIVVALEPDATLTDEAAALVLDSLPWLVEHVGKTTPESILVDITTTRPDREVSLALSPAGTRLELAKASDTAEARLRLPGESLVRLVYGRLDPGHTPSDVQADGVDLDLLRRVFPGV